jgi:hypothetical protein
LKRSLVGGGKAIERLVIGNVVDEPWTDNDSRVDETMMKQVPPNGGSKFEIRTAFRLSCWVDVLEDFNASLWLTLHSIYPAHRSFLLNTGGLRCRCAPYQPGCVHYNQTPQHRSLLSHNVMDGNPAIRGVRRPLPFQVRSRAGGDRRFNDIFESSSDEDGFDERTEPIAQGALRSGSKSLDVQAVQKADNLQLFEDVKRLKKRNDELLRENSRIRGDRRKLHMELKGQRKVSEVQGTSAMRFDTDRDAVIQSLRYLAALSIAHSRCLV